MDVAENEVALKARRSNDGSGIACRYMNIDTRLATGAGGNVSSLKR